MVQTEESMDIVTTAYAELSQDIKLRAINCELNPLTRSDGSALFSQGETCVLASVIGPIEAKSQNMKIEKATVECIYRPKAGLPNIRDKLQESIIRNTCEAALLTALHPRTTISIQLQELDNRCGLEACAINAACMALLIAGVPMHYTIAAVHCIINKEGQLLLDPDQCQAIGCIASFTFVFDSLAHDLVTCHTNGCFDMAQYNDAEMLSRAASDIIFKFYSNIITKSQNRTLLPATNEIVVKEEVAELQQHIKEEPMQA